MLTKALPTTLTTAHLLRVGTALTPYWQYYLGLQVVVVSMN